MPLLGVDICGSGVYAYYRNGEPTGVREPWRRWREADCIITESSRDAQVFGSRMTVRTEEAAQTDCRVTLRWEAVDGSRWAQAEYHRIAGVLHWQRSDSEGERNAQQGTVVLDDLWLLPLMRVHYGPVIVATEAQPNHRHRVLVPWIKDPRDTAQLFAPVISDREASLQGSDVLDTDQGTVTTRVFHYIGDQYQAGSSFWVDARGLLQRYRWRQDANTEWDTRLESLRLDSRAV